jgi:hypothetical protein
MKKGAERMLKGLKKVGGKQEYENKRGLRSNRSSKRHRN